MSAATFNRLLTWLAAIVFAAVAGEAYTAMAYEKIPGEVLATWPGIRAGVIIGGLVAGFEIFVMRGPVGAWFRRRSFLVALLARILVHTSFVVLGLLGNRILSASFVGHYVSDAFNLDDILQDVIFSFAVVAVTLFVLQMRTLIGGRTLLNVILGRYYRPVQESRLFVIVDLKGSTSLAEHIGDERFHAYLSAFFFEIDAAVSELGGEIYTYIGDGVIVSWPLEHAATKRNALMAIVSARDRLEQRATWFAKQFGQAPSFRAVVHGGPIVAGECGDSRRQITYLGDVLNTTARIEGLAKALNEDVVISDAMLSRLSRPTGMEAVSLGAHHLKGVAEDLPVSALRLPTPY